MRLQSTVAQVFSAMELQRLEQDAKNAAASEMLLMSSLIGKELEPAAVRERIQGAWTNVGLVGALFLTMLKLEPIECPEEVMSLMPSEYFCAHVHPFLCGFAVLGNTLAVILSTILYVQVSFVPDAFLGEWMERLSMSIESATLSFVFGAVFWALDVLWQMNLLYGIWGTCFSLLFFLAPCQ